MKTTFQHGRCSRFSCKRSISGTPKNHLQIGVWFNNYFLYKFVSSSNWNNQGMDGHQVSGRNDYMQKRITKYYSYYRKHKVTTSVRDSKDKYFKPQVCIQSVFTTTFTWICWRCLAKDRKLFSQMVFWGWFRMVTWHKAKNNIKQFQDHVWILSQHLLLCDELLRRNSLQRQGLFHIERVLKRWFAIWATVTKPWDDIFWNTGGLKTGSLA